MNENDVRRIVREAFSDAATRASESYGFVSDDTADSAALSQIKDVMQETADAIAVDEPNPFEPVSTPEQWAERIRSLIEEAQRDGMVFYFRSRQSPEFRIGTPVSGVSVDSIIWRAP